MATTTEDPDPEIAAMAQVSRALAPLEPDALRRVLKWAIERFEPTSRQQTWGVFGSPSVTASVEVPGIATESTRAPPRTFLSISELFDAAAPETGLDKVLVAAYWFQVLQQSEDWDGMSVNTELKHLGYPSTNITRDLDALMARKPKLAMQVKKQGTTKQARKLYRLTREGVRAVEAMLSRTAPFAES